MLCPFAAKRLVPNHGGPIGTIIGVVIHVTAGESDPFGTFANPLSQVSSHFGIGNGQGGMADGLIEQYVDTSLTAWAEAAGNAHYVSVETEGEPNEALTPAQVAAFGRLYAWLHEVHGVPFVITDTPGEAGFITHGDGGVPWGNHPGCPGELRKAQRATILEVAQPTPTTEREDTMTAVVMPNGDIKVYAASPAGHLLEFTRHDADQSNSVIDITDEIGGTPLYLVAP